MSDTPGTTPAATKMRNYRARLRAQGLRPVQIWVPDTKAPGFAEEVKRQSRIVADTAESREAAEWIETALDQDWELYE